MWDRLGNTNSFCYDTRGNVVQTTGPDGLSTRTVFDGDGKAVYVSDRNGITGTRTDYDLAGRITNTVRLTNISITISAGATVRWTNYDLHTHTVTSDTGLWDSGELAPNNRHSYTFSKPGTYTYHCTVHPGMKGTVIVQ